jgi:hypothetical protein
LRPVDPAGNAALFGFHRYGLRGHIDAFAYRADREFKVDAGRFADTEFDAVPRRCAKALLGGLDAIDPCAEAEDAVEAFSGGFRVACDPV